MGTRKLIAMGGCVAALALAPSALAGSNASKDAHRSAAVQVNAVLTRAPAGVPAAATAGEGQLPMSGVDVSVIAAAGLGLAGMGFAMRRLAGREELERD